MRNLFLISAFLTLLTSCASTNYYPQAVNSWQGSRIENLTSHWGPPDRVVNMPNGNTYYVYVSQSYQSSAPTLTPGYATYTNTSGKPVMATLLLPSPPTYYQLQCTTWFEANSKGIITAAQAKGNYCFSDPAMTRAIENPARPVRLME